MSVIGTGVDLVENQRIREMLEKWGDKFTTRVFVEREREYCEKKASPWLYYAGRFAVKEAVSKAFGIGIGPRLSWMDIEVVRCSDTGAPSVEFSEKGKVLAREFNVGKVLVSLSHTRNFAIANALLIEKGPAT
jgi:holo-[acyl-carrier protein] synthase